MKKIFTMILVGAAAVLASVSCNKEEVIEASKDGTVRFYANEIKTIRSLREKKFRDSFGLFVVEGEKMVAEALESGLEVTRLIRREEVGEAVMSRISSLSTAPPVLAVVRQKKAELPAKPSGLCSEPHGRSFPTPCASSRLKVASQDCTGHKRPTERKPC